MNQLTSTASDVLFYVGAGFLIVAFGCAVAQNFVGQKAAKILNWITAGCSIVTFVCFILHELL